MGASGPQPDVIGDDAAKTTERPRGTRLLAAKLRPPELPRSHVPRPRLSKQLSPLDTGLTLLSAPPGTGKTTLLAEWAASEPEPRLAWVSVDVLDNDPHRFWAYVIASLQQYEATVGVEMLDLLLEGTDEELLQTVESLAADLADVSPPITLIIDDLHRVDARPVLRSLDYLVGHLPAGLRLILSTRADPPLALHRFRAHGELRELRQSDLRFSEEDVQAFFQRFDGLRLQPAEVRILTEKTEGWIAGLQLAALSFRGEEDPSASVERFAVLHPTLDDYFLGEVLEHQPKDVQEFLLRTSILEDLTPPLCDAITERGDSHLLLRELEAQNLFVSRAQAASNSYRYHHLFADLLQTEFRARDHGAWRLAHRRAADWYEADGRPLQALEHLFAGQFHEEALNLLIDSITSLWDLGQGMTVPLWLDRFPAAFFDTRPKRMLDLALVLTLGGRYAEAGRCLDQVESILSLPGQPDPVQEARLAGVRSVWAMFQGEGTSSIDWMEKALGSYRPDADDGYIDRLPYALARSWVWMDDTEAATAALRASYKVPPPPESIGRLLLPAAMSLVRFFEGHLQEAERFSDDALAYVDLPNPDLPGLTEARLVRAGVLLERNQLDESEREFERALQAGESHHQVPAVVPALLGLARIWAVSGRRDGAFDLYGACRRANGPLVLPEPFATRVNVAEARALLGQGAVAEARRLIDQMPPSVVSLLLRARLALATGDTTQASELLARMKGDLTTPRRRLQWQIVDAQAGSASAKQSLRDALGFAARERFIRCFVDEGDALRRLLHEQSGSAPGRFVQDVLAAFESSTHLGPTGRLVDPLSEREQVVLSYLPSWVSVKEIAAELYISSNTLKTHLRSIYRKLGASSRRDAVRLAKSRHLL